MNRNNKILFANLAMAIILAISGSGISVFKIYCACEKVEKTSILLEESCCGKFQNNCDNSQSEASQIGHKCCSQEINNLIVEFYEVTFTMQVNVKINKNIFNYFKINDFNDYLQSNSNVLAKAAPPALKISENKVISFHQIRIPSEEESFC
jgi:hypothetical protein